MENPSNGKSAITRNQDLNMNKKQKISAYELPGGKIESGETVEEGLKREIREEFEIDIEIENPLHAFTYTKEAQPLPTIEIVYYAKMKYLNQQIKPNPKEHSEYKWITQEELEGYLGNNEKEYEAAIKGFELLNRL